MASEHQSRPGSRIVTWLIYTLLLVTGILIGASGISLLYPQQTEKIRFADEHIPTLMMHPLGRDGAYRRQIGNWQLFTSLTKGNNSLVLKYEDTFVATFSAAPDSSLESIVLNHPLYNTIMLIIERLNEKGVAGKLTTDILAGDGRKTGFVIDENMDGQPDLRFEYAGPYLYVWLNQSWSRVMRSSPSEYGGGFKHSVMYNEALHEIHLEEYPYRLEPLKSEE